MIEFWSFLTHEQVAHFLAPCIYVDASLDEGVPFLSNRGRWYELSQQNDHKIDDRDEMDDEGRHLYAFRDRYYDEERAQRVKAALAIIGASIQSRPKDISTS